MAFIVEAGIIVIICYFIFELGKWINSTYKSHSVFERLGIPGPEPSFFSGNRSTLEKLPFIEVTTSWIKRYGNVFGYFIGKQPVLYINDPVILNELLVKQSATFINRFRTNVKVYPLDHSLLDLRDQRWKEMRRLLSPMFHDNHIRNLSSEINNKVRIVLEVIAKKAQLDEEFDICEILNAYAFETTAECLLGLKVGCLKDPDNELYRCIRKFVLMFDQSVIFVGFFYSNIFEVFKGLKKYVALRRTASSIVRQLEHQTNNWQNQPYTHRNVLKIMMDNRNESMINGDRERRPKPVTNDEILGNILFLLTTGFDTSAMAMSFTFHLLCQHQSVQEKLHNEVCSTTLSDSAETYESVQRMEYMNGVWCESLRLYPPAPKVTVRQCSKTCSAGKYTIPEGTIVQAAMWNMHYDPQFWEDPWKFKPERFCNVDGTCKSGAYIPGGIGQRSCIGMRFSNFISKLLIGRLIQQFRFVSCDKTADPLPLDDSGMLLRPATGVFLKAIVRKH